MAFCISKLKPIPEVAGHREVRKALFEPEHHFGICLSGRNDMKKAKTAKALKKEYDQMVREEKKRGRRAIASIRKLKRKPFEEFRSEVCGWLESLFTELEDVSNEVGYGFIQDREHMDTLIAVLKKVRDKDQEEFKIIQTNADTFHKWLEDLAEMAFFNAMLTFRIYHKRGLTEAEVRRLAKPYHIDPLFLDSPENPWRKAEEMFCAAMQTVADRVEGVQP